MRALLIIILVLCARLSYSQGNVDTVFYDNGEIKSIIERKGDLLTQKYFLRKGILHREIINKGDSIFIKVFYSDCNCIKEFHWGRMVDSSFEGKISSYSKEGKLSEDSEVINNHKKVIIYYPSGRIKEIKNYCYSYLSGPTILYYENGQIREDGNMEYNCKSGLWNEYYENGQLRSEGNYIVDQNSVFYYKELKDALKNKTVAAFVPIEIKMIKNGIWKYFNERGDLIKTEKYKGKLKRVN